jgi:arylsulfatase A-like enzyme
VGALKAIGAAVATALVAAACGHNSPSEHLAALPRRPNIVVVLVDDLDTKIDYWSAMPKTAKLLRDRGLVFRNAFVTDPVCAPSRATLLTGLYPHNNGVLDAPTGNDAYKAFAATAESRSVAVALHDDDYRTGFIGKYVNGYELTPNAVPPGWDEWFGLAGTFLDGYTYDANHNGRIEHFGKRASDYQTDVLTRTARHFVADAPRRDPLFLYLSPSAPHSSIDAARRDANNPYAHASLPTTKNFNEADLSDKPTWLRDGGWPLVSPTHGDEATRYRHAMGSLYAVDDMVASTAAELRRSGRLDNTVFVFMSDNGMNRGSHRLPEKLAPYEESIRVPLVVAGPGIRHGTDDHFVTNLDLTPTLLDLAGLPSSGRDGRSIVPLLRNQPVQWNDEMLVEHRARYSSYIQVLTLADVQNRIAHDGTEDYVPSYLAIRNDRWLYVRWYEGDAHEYELYDLKKDPAEMQNLLASPTPSPAIEATAEALAARLDALSTCAGASCR